TPQTEVCGYKDNQTTSSSVCIRTCSDDQRLAAAATRSAASSRGWRCAPRRGSDVSTTQMVSLAGSAQKSVPVEPVWPKVCSEQPGLPDSLPTPKPNPRDVKPFGLWFLVISRAVWGL